MKGNWIYVAISASLGMTAALFSFHPIVLLVIVGYLFWILVTRSKGKLFSLSAFTVILFAVNFLWIDVHNQTTLSGKEHEFIGEIISIPKIDGNQLSFVYQLPTNEKLQAFYYFKKEAEQEQFKQLTIGMSCHLTGQIKQPERAGNFDGFDYQKYLYYNRIHWLFTPNDFTPAQCTPLPSTKYMLPRWRSAQLSFIQDHFPEKTVGIMQALIFGEQQQINLTVKENFQRFGIIHLLVISGSHVALIIVALFYFFIRIGLTRERSFFFIFLLLPIYMILAGASPSVIRSCIVPMLVLVSLKFKTKLNPLDALSIAFLLMCFVNPYYILDIGFQLSFIVSFALILSSGTILRLYKNPLTQLIAITIIAQLCSLPIMFFYFYEVSFLSLPLNIIFVPLMSIVILPLTFLTYFSELLFAPAGSLFAELLTEVIHYSFALLEWTNHFSRASLTLGKPAYWLLIVYYIAIIYGFMSWEKGGTISKLRKPFLVFVTVLFFHCSSPYMENEGMVTMIDVGQGDSFLIELPRRHAVYLIDTGGKLFFDEEDWEKRQKPFDVGEDVIAPLLKAKGIRTIDKLILTHGDWDHIGGTKGLLKHVKVKEVITGVGEVAGKEDKELQQVLADQHIPIRKVKAGDEWSSGDQHFYVLGPTGKETTKNDSSVVIYTSIGGVRWLFTGDLEKKGESRLLGDYPQLQVDVLKVGHHGSNSSTSSAFVKQLKPIVALISVGESNRFGHPHTEVIQSLSDQSVQIFRTDVNGSVRYKFTKNKGTFYVKYP